MAYRPDTGERVGLVEGIMLVLFPPFSWNRRGLEYPLNTSSVGPLYYVPRTVFIIAGTLLNLIATPFMLIVILLGLALLPLALIRDAVAPSLMIKHPRLAVWPMVAPGVLLIWLIFVPAKAMYLLAFFWDLIFGPKIDLVNVTPPIANLDLIDNVMETWTHSNRIEMDAEEDTRLLIALTMAATIPAKEAVERFPTLSTLWGRGDESKARRLLAIWFASVTLTFAFRKYPDSDPKSVIDGWVSTAELWMPTIPSRVVYGMGEQYLRDLERLKVGEARIGSHPGYDHLLLTMSVVALSDVENWEEVDFSAEYRLGILDPAVLDSGVLDPREFNLEDVEEFATSSFDEAVALVPKFMEDVRGSDHYQTREAHTTGRPGPS